MVKTSRNRRSHGRAMYLEALEKRELRSTVAWTGGGSDGLWNTADNWVDTATSSHRAPSEDDDVLLPQSTWGEIELDSDVTVASLTIGSNSDVELNGPSDSQRMLTVTGLFSITTEDVGEGGDNSVFLGATITMVTGTTAVIGSDSHPATVTIDGGALIGPFVSITSDTTDGAAFIAAVHAASTGLGGAATAAATAGTGASSIGGLSEWATTNTGNGPPVSLGISTGGSFTSMAVNGALNVSIDDDPNSVLDVAILNVKPNSGSDFAISGPPGSANVATSNLSIAMADGTPRTSPYGKQLVMPSYAFPYAPNPRTVLTTSAALSWMVGDATKGVYLQANGATFLGDPYMNAYSPNLVDLGFSSSGHMYKIAFYVGANDQGAVASTLEIDGTMSLGGAAGDSLRCMRAPDAIPPASEAFMIIKADSGISGSFSDMNYIDGTSIGLEDGTYYHAEVRNTTELWLIKNSGT